MLFHLPFFVKGDELFLIERGYCMQISNQKIYSRAETLLKQLYGNEASFREGQYEAIESVFTHKRSLVVQRTGWGKSLVYFMATKINRENGAGFTIVVSPLIVLMENQSDAASKMGLKSCVLNNQTKDTRDSDIADIKRGYYDVVFTTPETLFTNEIKTQIGNFRIGLFVIDEAHCISEWGHDFRLEYSNLNQLIKFLPPQVPVLGTTATANDRVVEDLKRQFGDNVYISRGLLHRESLAIQVLKMKDKAERYAWIKKNINSLPGSGIIYCLTTRDCDYLAEYLQENGIDAMSYHSGKDDEYCREVETLFSKNKIKALVATIKLGMGYDKDDIGFVIHFQRPANIVNYYQQIGRAGRNLDFAYVFLMSGSEDEDIHDYFINTAFPSLEEAKKVAEVIEKNPESGRGFIESRVNIPKNRVEKTLSFLVNEGIIFKEKSKYTRSATRFKYNEEYYKQITDVRRKEQVDMRELINTKKCYSRFIINSLGDNSQIKCGKCVNCTGKELISSELSIEEKQEAAEHINRKTLIIVPRKQWATTSLTKMTKIKYQNQEGICLSKYGDVGYGEIIKNCKANSKEYPKEIINRTVEVLVPLIREKNIKYLTYIPSLRSNLFADFAEEVAKLCNIELIKPLSKTSNTQQKQQQNSSYQCYNALTSYKIVSSVPRGPIILMDDMVDSRWTLTVCGFKLMESGATEVYPFALTDSSKRGDDGE